MKYFIMLLLLVPGLVYAKDYTGSITPPFPEGVENRGGVLVDFQHTSELKWSQNLVRIKDTDYLWLNTFVERKEKKAYFKVVHQLELSTASDMILYFATCMNKKTNEQNITGLASGKADQEWHHNVVKAWRPNTTAGKIEAVETTNIICHNEAYGL